MTLHKLQLTKGAVIWAFTEDSARRAAPLTAKTIMLLLAVALMTLKALAYEKGMLLCAWTQERIGRVL